MHRHCRDHEHNFYCDLSECHSRLLNFFCVVKQFFLRSIVFDEKGKHLISAEARWIVWSMTSWRILFWCFLSHSTVLYRLWMIAAISYSPFRVSTRLTKSLRVIMWTRGSLKDSFPAPWLPPSGRVSRTSWEWVLMKHSIMAIKNRIRIS